MQIPQIWLGSEASFERHLSNMATYYERHPEYLLRENELRAQLAGFSQDEDEMTLSDYLAQDITSKQGAVGMVTIKGSLVNEESFFNLWFGDTAYQTVQTALHTLLEDQEIKQIVTIWDTYGGTADGINDFGTFIKDAAKIKPITGWTGSKALSAGYWGLACCNKARSSEMGETGSIGAVAKFTSVSRMLKERGVDTLIARSAPMKAILQSEEPVDEKKKAYLQEKVDALHVFFVDHIKTARPKLAERDQSEWASGETFFAETAIAMGLVDGPPISLGGLVSQLQAKADKDSERQKTQGTNMARNVVLSDQVAAQLMSGISVPGVSLADGGEPSQVAEGEAPGSATEQSTGQAPELSAGGEVADSPSAPDGVEASPTPPENPAPVVDSGLSAYLQARAEKLEGEVAELKLKQAKTEAQLAEIQGVENLLKPIAVEALQRFQVALGQTPQSYEGLPARTIAEAYSATRALLEERLPSGRRSLEGSDSSRTAASIEEARIVQLVAHQKAKA